MARIRDIPSFTELLDEESIKKLSNLDILHVEQLHYIITGSEGYFGLKQLELSCPRPSLLEASKNFLIKKHGSTRNFEFGLTSLNDGNNTNLNAEDLALGLAINEEISYQSPINDQRIGKIDKDNTTKSFSLYRDGSYPTAKDQGIRGTCGAFAATAMLEAFIDANYQTKEWTRVRDYSEQYLFYRARQNVSNRNHLKHDGATLVNVMEALIEFGVCASSYLPYRSNHDWGHGHLFNNTRLHLDRLDRAAKGNRIKDFQSIDLNKEPIIDVIKDCLQKKMPVIVGLYIFKSGWQNQLALSKGIINLPILYKSKDGKKRVAETSSSGHAITIYGYKEDDEEYGAGGGYFIFRNSWGASWAYGNTSINTAGYGIISYEYIRLFAIEAVYMTGMYKE